MLEIIIAIGVFSFIVGIIFDYLLFRWWHGLAHSRLLKEQEKKQKQKEFEESYRDEDGPNYF